MSGRLVLLILAIASAGAVGSDVESFSDRDAAVFTLALADFDRSRESHDFSPPWFVAVPSESKPLQANIARPSDISAAAELRTPAPLATLENYLQRNRVRFRVRLSASAPASLHLVAINGPSCAPSISRAPGVRTCAYPRAPGFSADGEWAFVGFDFLWSIHSGTAAYLLRKSAGVWTVVDKNFAIYL